MKVPLVDVPLAPLTSDAVVPKGEGSHSNILQ